MNKIFINLLAMTLFMFCMTAMRLCDQNGCKDVDLKALNELATFNGPARKLTCTAGVHEGCSGQTPCCGESGHCNAAPDGGVCETVERYDNMY